MAVDILLFYMYFSSSLCCSFCDFSIYVPFYLSYLSYLFQDHIA